MFVNFRRDCWWTERVNSCTTFQRRARYSPSWSSKEECPSILFTVISEVKRNIWTIQEAPFLFHILRGKYITTLCCVFCCFFFSPSFRRRFGLPHSDILFIFNLSVSMCCLALLKHSQIKYKITYQQRERRELANNNQGKGGRSAYMGWVRKSRRPCYLIIPSHINS